MNCLAFERRSADGTSAPRLDWMTLVKFLEFARKAVLRDAPIGRARTAKYDTLFGIAQAACRFDQRIEHGLQIEGRATDDFEHVGGRGLLLQRFAQLVEQPCVLDGD